MAVTRLSVRCSKPCELRPPGRPGSAKPPGSPPAPTRAPRVGGEHLRCTGLLIRGVPVVSHGELSLPNGPRRGIETGVELRRVDGLPCRG